ncbi:hypothetical protein Tco_1170672, partial [Tanacetum coccineum]
LDEFKEPKFFRYDIRDTVLKTTIDCEKESDNFKENTDDSFEKEQVSDNENSSIESLPNVVKKTVFHAAKKIEFVKPKNNEKPIKKTVSFDHMKINCPHHQRKRMVTRNNYNRVDYDYYAKTSHPTTHRNMTPRAVLLKSGLKPLSIVRPVYTAHPKPTVHSAKSMSQFSKQAQSTVQRPFYKKPSLTNRAIHISMIKEFDGGNVTFGGGAYSGRISGKGTLKTDSLDFDDVYFVKELNFNLFSVS